VRNFPPFTGQGVRVLSFGACDTCGQKNSLGAREFLTKLYQDSQRITRANLILIARTFLVELGKKGLMENLRPREWYYGFEYRWHGELNIAQLSQLEKMRSSTCAKLVVG
jgi:hypothetical protein